MWGSNVLSEHGQIKQGCDWDQEFDVGYKITKTAHHPDGTRVRIKPIPLPLVWFSGFYWVGGLSQHKYCEGKVNSPRRVISPASIHKMSNSEFFDKSSMQNVLALFRLSLILEMSNSGAGVNWFGSTSGPLWPWSHNMSVLWSRCRPLRPIITWKYSRCNHSHRRVNYFTTLVTKGDNPCRQRSNVLMRAA